VKKHLAGGLNRNHWFGAGLLLAVVSTVIAGVLVMGPPAQQRELRLDERRVSDLREIAAAVDVYWTREGRLPSSLDELAGDDRWFADLVDPVSGAAYEYRIVSDDAYELCAVFALETGAFSERDFPVESAWIHEAGVHCYRLQAQTVDLDSR
jgi:hypothetical protein